MRKRTVAMALALAVACSVVGAATAGTRHRADVRVTFVRVAIPAYLSDSGDPEFGVDVCFKGVLENDTIPQFTGSVRVAHAYTRNKSKTVHRATRSLSFDLATDVGSSIDTDTYTLNVNSLDP